MPLEIIARGGEDGVIAAWLMPLCFATSRCRTAVAKRPRSSGNTGRRFGQGQHRLLARKDAEKRCRPWPHGEPAEPRQAHGSTSSP
jgi:hypothetical protein